MILRKESTLKCFILFTALKKLILEYLWASKWTHLSKQNFHRERQTMHRIPGLLSLSFLAASCQVGPKYEPPFLEMPCAWHSPAQELQESSSDCFLWWESLNDPLLSY